MKARRTIRRRSDARPLQGLTPFSFAVRGEEYRYLTAPVLCEEFLLCHSCETQKTASQQGEGGRFRYWRVGGAGCREGDGPVPLSGEAEGAHGSVEARSGEIGSSAEHRDGNSADHQVRRRDAVDRGRQGANRERGAAGVRIKGDAHRASGDGRVIWNQELEGIQLCANPSPDGSGQEGKGRSVIGDSAINRELTGDGGGVGRKGRGEAKDESCCNVPDIHFISVKGRKLEGHLRHA